MAENCYFYLNLTPESLVASQLDPLKFGTYLATGTQKRSHGEAIYFELDPTGLEGFDLDYARQRCVTAPDGRPKHSVYIGIYRVLEHIPLGSIRELYLTTRDGRTLKIDPSDQPPPEPVGRYYLYQELCPVHPLIASTLNPAEFVKFMTDITRPLHVPRLAFVDMELEDLAEDPMTARVKDLPYENIEHIRFCVAQLTGREKGTKTVNRMQPLGLPYRTIRSGFYVGDNTAVKYWPFPSPQDLDRYHHDWWRSANV